MTVTEVNTKKDSQASGRRSPNALVSILLLTIALPVVLCGAFYGPLWLLGRFGGEWIGSQIITPVAGGEFVTGGSFQQDTIIFNWRLYMLPGTLDEVASRVVPKRTSTDAINLCYDDCNASSMLYRIYGSGWSLSHQENNGRTYFNGAIHSRCYFSQIYRDKAAFFADMKDYFPAEMYAFPDSLPPDAVIQFMQTCYYAID